MVENCQDDGDTGLALAAFRGHLDASRGTEQWDGEGTGGRSLKGVSNGTGQGMRPWRKRIQKG